MGTESKAELVVAEALRVAGIPFRRHQQVGRYEVDFMVGRKVVLEVDGYSHLPRNRREYDRERQRFIEDLGYTVLRITNQEAYDASRLRRFLSEVREAVASEYQSENELKDLPFQGDDLQALKDHLEATERRRQADQAGAGPQPKRRRRLLTPEEMMREWLDKHGVPDKK